jgi:hypothetical protein
MCFVDLLPTKIGRAYHIMLKVSRTPACGDLDMKVNSAPAERDAVRQAREVDRLEDVPYRQHVAVLLFQRVVLDRADDESGLGEEDRHGRTELEWLIRRMLKRAHQGSFKHAELLLNYGFGRP